MSAATEPKQSLDAKQRAWLKKMSTALDAPNAGGDVLASSADTVKAFGPEDVLVDVLKTALGPRTALCKLTNRTGRTLQLDQRSLVNQPEHGEFKTFPPDDLNKDGEFLVVNKSILGASLTGAEGEIKYLLDQQGTTWSIRWNNPRAGKNTADSQVKGPNAAQYKKPVFRAGSGDEATFTYLLEPVSDPGPEPGPKPSGVDVATSCHVTVTNETNVELKLGGQGHERGDFMTFPAKTLAPGASTSFISVETTNAKDPNDEGCKGFVLWQVGSPNVLWRVEWENFEGSKNVATASFNPPNAAFTSLNQIGQGDENVPVAFTISGGGGGQPPTGTGKLSVFVYEESADPKVFKPIEGADVEVGGKSSKTKLKGQEAVAEFELPVGTHSFRVSAADYEEKHGTTNVAAKDDNGEVVFLKKKGGTEPELVRPPESKQPTLRKGDKSADGWVEYLQQLLNSHGAKLEVDGKFGDATLKAVKEFQTKNKLLVDGIVGNQTWAALRGQTPEPPSTDGRQPHTHVEKGAEARWFHQGKSIVVYHPENDELDLIVTSVGDAPIDKFQAKVRVTTPQGKQKPVSIDIGPPYHELPSGAGHLHAVRLHNYKKTFGAGMHTVEGLLPEELGGGYWKEDVEIK
jgi:peptidoglycan hydrolase-like protein with peptidoglycan-binding domain